MSQDTFSSPVQSTSVLATNKLIKNTYILLSMTLLFSALMAGISSTLSLPVMTNLICSGIALALIWFVLPRVANSSAGLPVVFAVTGLLGFGLGPVISAYLALPNGSHIVGLAMAGTGTIFLGLSAYALITRKDFSFMGGFLMVGFLTVIVAAVANLFFKMPALSVAISSAVILLMSGFILFDTSRMIHQPQRTNYIMMTVSLYLNILNIFTSLLHILGIASDD